MLKSSAPFMDLDGFMICYAVCMNLMQHCIVLFFFLSVIITNSEAIYFVYTRKPSKESGDDLYLQDRIS